MPLPDREAPTTWQILGKAMEFFNLLDAGEKKKFEIKEVGNGTKSGR